MLVEEDENGSKKTGNRRPLWLIIGFVLAIAWVGVGTMLRPASVRPFFGPITTTDINQTRLNTAVPIPRGNFSIQQSFVPRWDGLREIELILVRYEEATPEENGRFTLRLYDPQNNLIAENSLQTRHIQHNQTHTFRFPPQPHSAGQSFSLHLSGSDDNPVTVWGYDLDVYELGQMQLVFGPLGEATVITAVQELRFLTRNQLTFYDALAALGTRLRNDGWPLLLALLFMPLPGCLLLQAAAWWQAKKQPAQVRPVSDIAAWWGLALALGIATWPLIWYGLTLVNGRLSGWLLWLMLLIGWSAALYRHIRQRQASASLPAPAARPNWATLLLLILLLLTITLRLLAVRDLAFPAWVDASRHGIITAVMAANGRTPTHYAPYLPTVERFPYHFGFHSLAASLQMMSDWPLPQLLLSFGQLLNGLMPLMLYTAVAHLSKQRQAALLAAFLVALPFFFPAYYATWGRFTQLTAMLIMPILLATTWRLLSGQKEVWWQVSLLATGLFYIHLRVFLLYIPFVAVAWLVHRGRQSQWLALATFSSGLLVAPRFYELWTMTEPAAAISSTLPNYNAFPTSYAQAGWEQHFLWLAAFGFLLCLAAWRWRQKWAALPLSLAGWVALLFIALAGERLGLPETSLINTNSMYITLFVPLAIFLAITAVRGWQWLLPQRPLWQTPALILAGAALALSTLFGIRQQLTILNPQTILAQTADVAALNWANEHLPADAKVAVSSWQWLGNTWAATDGGSWLVPLTGRASTTPPADYIYNGSLFLEVAAFNEAATAVTDWSTPEQATWLRQQGISHIFIGAKGGFFDPAALHKNPETNLIYAHDGTFIFALAPTAE